MNPGDLNCRNIFISNSFQKHIFGGFEPKSTKMALKVNEINVPNCIESRVRFSVPPTRQSVHHKFSYCWLLFTTTNHAFGPPSLNEMSFGSGRTSYRDGSTDSITQPWLKATSISFRLTLRGP